MKRLAQFVLVNFSTLIFTVGTFNYFSYIFNNPDQTILLIYLFVIGIAIGIVVTHYSTLLHEKIVRYRITHQKPLKRLKN